MTAYIPSHPSGTIPFESVLFTVAGGLTLRTVPQRLGDIVNAADYGIVGDGSTDNHAALQAAIDAAFGPASSPNGMQPWKNRPLFIPNGSYIVSAPLGPTAAPI